MTLLEILHPLSIKSLFEKVERRQVPVTGFYTRKFDLSIVNHYFQRYVAAQCLRSLHCKQHENEDKYQSKRGRF